jgi:hypothetical protein
MRKLITIILLGSITISLTAQKQKKSEETKQPLRLIMIPFSSTEMEMHRPFPWCRANAICGVPEMTRHSLLVIPRRCFKN